MEQSSGSIVRIGMVDYLNTAPIIEKWKATVTRKNWVLVEDVPAALDKKLEEGTIDLGFVSSLAYARHPQKYKLLSGLSVSASGSVASVVLLSHVPIEQLHGADVLLSSQGVSSVELVKIILEEFHNVIPNYHNADAVDTAETDFKAMLAVGDDALQLVDSAAYLYQFDLGDIWRRKTGLPFVYSVCVVQEEFCQTNPEMLAEIHRELLRCKDEGMADIENICATSAVKKNLSKRKCRDYLEAISYDLSSQKCKALEAFIDILITRGVADADALPLKKFAKMD